MDISSFRQRLGLSQAQLAEKLGLATGSVGNLCSNTKKPSYEVIERLFMLGARIDEVFSPEVQAEVLKNCGASLPPIPPGMDSPEWRRGMLEALADLQRMGYIKDVVVEGVEKEKDGP